MFQQDKSCMDLIVRMTTGLNDTQAFYVEFSSKINIVIIL